MTDHTTKPNPDETSSAPPSAGTPIRNRAIWYEAQRDSYTEKRDKWAAILSSPEAAVGKERDEFLSSHMAAACMEAAQIVAYLNIKLAEFSETFGK